MARTVKATTTVTKTQHFGVPFEGWDKRLREWMKDHPDLSQNEASRRAGVGSTTINRLINNQFTPSIKTIWDVCAANKIPIRWVLFGDSGVPSTMVNDVLSAHTALLAALSTAETLDARLTMLARDERGRPRKKT